MRVLSLALLATLALVASAEGSFPKNAEPAAEFKHHEHAERDATGSLIKAKAMLLSNDRSHDDHNPGRLVDAKLLILSNNNGLRRRSNYDGEEGSYGEESTYGEDDEDEGAYSNGDESDDGESGDEYDGGSDGKTYHHHKHHRNYKSSDYGKDNDYRHGHHHGRRHHHHRRPYTSHYGKQY
ncbi:hypothetical protein BJ684DRAFT_16364 [Piptocephalis cylindrospora]|uniref:Uncharacterized protein n=1 Tax=Piptocephalis cylindrospora TaxID=1907219 RepID=A0A4P9Y2Y7_9FUNG|nr:hypothetical protein BJ684DRAFT_16364 [Piptocephalis cylindrospora]|eukprot:RKP13215.1 hypothetical protein BJ684DRAFT_16364 [Piptocephalis cylindrospora]